MSVVDTDTVQPAGSCAHGTVHTAWQVTHRAARTW